ncbi:universal stress protein [Natrialba asiatica]|uniref:UspA domain-containing protein n=1 Tax=Natrialba asiatica (strain ATCC 700177 / DSM 12278 / JCM 9576 / FERM P-10747 / NBRC 102637 / 172P1) TaxID=29540 RepID=M0B7S8_NATA1|nr:universal stress protein [Natrialba asiatica]ELZ05699.1 UspA domain-containing protein [Natrialba asiatica DSM 12278]
MDDSLLVPVDGSDPARAALKQALDIAVDTGATVHVLHVVPANESRLLQFGDRDIDVLEDEGEEIVDRARSAADERNVAVVDTIVQGEPQEQILTYAESHSVDCIIMGAHGRHGLEEYILGSTTERVVHRSAVPVMTVRAGEDVTQSYPYRSVLVPTDDSDHARAALKLGSTVAARHDSMLHLLFVVDELPETIDPRSTPLSAELKENAHEVLQDAADRTKLSEESLVTAVKAGSVPHQITSYAESTSTDLIVMGTHGWTGLDRYLLGSFTERVIRTSPVPVLTTSLPKDESRS